MQCCTRFTYSTSCLTKTGHTVPTARILI
ncbi:hypothetical protein Zm00014a_019216 [Zea mays]|uniref:Uncharacterized protein n=1 Tax=Zea mays TaxID=4577 RepID=A0A3L6F2A0_MAIZE|nr:hypothetical protein Zm00014a_019216 [Zea mays]